METISIQHPHKLSKHELPELSIALGYFDGVHLGHQKVILQAKSTAEAKGLKSAVMTFEPHPSVVLGKDVQHVEAITPLEDKIGLISKMGIDYLFVVHFSKDFANLLPQEFVNQYLIGLNARHVTAGYDFSFGLMGKGSMDTLPIHARDQFDYTVVSKLEKNHEKISSSKIRKLISNGEINDIPSLLGRYYATSGIVIHGDKRGRTIGFPTANIDLEDDYLLPHIGVYAVRIQVDGQWYEGVCNVGNRPTFYHENKDKPSVEVHILDFSKEIYDEQVTIEWHRHLRNEQKFNGIQELIAQIEKDKENTLRYFKKYKV